MQLIFCGGKNKAFYEISNDAGFLYGAQLPCVVHGPLFFADQDWLKPRRAEYMAALSLHKPTMASVLDWERPEQLPEVLSWAEEAALWVDVVLIVPKVVGGVSSLPRRIGGKSVRLGYSVQNKPRHGKKENVWGGTTVPDEEFAGWPVHLLGGSPGKQMMLAETLDVHSADGNMAQAMATGYCAFWVPGKKPFANRWPSLAQADGKRWEGNGPQEAFRRSCESIMAAWRARGYRVNVDL